MKRLMVSALVLMASLTQAKELKGIVKHSPDVQIPLGSTCYDIPAQMMLDQALEQGVSCQATLDACRKWRDKYKAQLLNESDSVEFEPEVSISEPKWLKPVVIGVFGFGLGVTIGSVF